MNYAKFKKIENLDLKILSFLGILQTKSRIIQINNYPDYDLSGYGGQFEKTYYFTDSWSFDGEFGAVLNVSIESQRVFHSDDMERLSEEYDVHFGENNAYDLVLNEIRNENEHLMWSEGFPPDFDGFKLNDIRVDRIDHSKKEVHFFGSYDGDSSSIQPVDWNIFIECSFCSFISSTTSGKFYVDLISESYSLKDSGNMKLSFFLVYAALENYINECLDRHEKEGRIKDKLNELFRSRFTSLEKHQIYTSAAGEFDDWEKIRNWIVHGKAKVDITNEMVEEFTIFVLTLMASFEAKETIFDSLLKEIDKP